MAQEIYHRSEWGNPTETWGNVYLNADLTNELYKRASEYENSWVTDQLLNGVGIKPSIILTPTAYEDGVLNSVKPAKPYSDEIAINGNFDTDSDWSKDTGWTISNGEAIHTGSGTYISQTGTTIGKNYRVVIEVTQASGSGFPQIYMGGLTTAMTSPGTYTFDITATSTLIRLRGLNDCKVTSISVKEVLHADFDFTRGSSATRVNEQGLVEDVQILSGELVQNGDFEQIGSELVTNGGFDENINGWVDYLSTSIWDNGSIKSIVTTNVAYIRQNSVVTANKFYKVTFKAKSTNISQNIRIFNGTTFVDTGLNFDEVNTYKDFTYYLYTTVSQIIIGQTGLSVGDAVNFDNVSVKEVGQNWTFGTGWSIAEINGNQVAEFDGGADAAIQQGSLLTSGKKYRLSIEVANKTTGSLQIRFGNTGVVDETITTNGTFTYDLISDGSTLYLRSISGFDGYIDNVSVIEVTDDTDLPRINYTYGEGSLLLEPQSTNLIPYSEDFSSYVKSGLTAESGYLSPSGATNATKITATNTDPYLSYIVSGVTDLTYSASIYIKGTSSTVGETARLWIIRDNVVYKYEDFTITSEWQRISTTQTFTSTPTSFVALRLDLPNTNVSVNDESYVWGTQLEALSYSTSLIPTNGSTVTRLADVCNNSGNSDLINSTEGVLYAEISALADDLTNRSISISDGSTNNRVNILYSNSTNQIRVIVVVGGSTKFDQNYNVTSITDIHKIAVKYKADDFALWVDGVERLTDTSGTIFAQDTLNELAFNIGGGILPFYGNVKCVAVFKEALSDTELQKLTTI